MEERKVGFCVSIVINRYHVPISITTKLTSVLPDALKLAARIVTRLEPPPTRNATAFAEMTRRIPARAKTAASAEISTATAPNFTRNIPPTFAAD